MRRPVSYTNGLRFSCVRCSACCRYESGFVYLSEEDVSRLMKALRVSRPEFEAVYCRWAPSGGFETLSLKETPAYDCVLWDKGCSVYESRPLQCRAFPFWRTLLADEAAWKSAAAECPGMGSGEARSREEIDAFLAERDAQPFIQRRITL